MNQYKSQHENSRNPQTNATERTFQRIAHPKAPPLVDDKPVPGDGWKPVLKIVKAVMEHLSSLQKPFWFTEVSASTFSKMETFLVEEGVQYIGSESFTFYNGNTRYGYGIPGTFTKTFLKLILLLSSVYAKDALAIHEKAVICNIRPFLIKVTRPTSMKGLRVRLICQNMLSEYRVGCLRIFGSSSRNKSLKCDIFACCGTLRVLLQILAVSPPEQN